jgi:sigma-B regulation protein RsbU (phosphoserine phosphatase)
VRDRVLNDNTSVLVRDTQQDEAFRSRVSIVQQRVRTLMAVPLQTNERVIGLIYVDSPSMLKEFTKDDLALLTVMANVAAIRIEHARLLEVEQAERMMARELENAAEIQQSFLPSGPPYVPGADIAGHNAPSSAVGGDYYDFFTYEDGSVAMVLGDVSGKGMPSSLMMMALQARVRALLGEFIELAGFMDRLNRLTAANCPPAKFITFCASILNPFSGQLVWCNAGHNRPLIVRGDGTIEVLEGGGLPLGILPVTQYEQSTALLQPGDTFVLYSDGVTEAMNPSEEDFGEDRLQQVLTAHRNEPAKLILEAVLSAVREWSAGAAQADDITLLVARMT